MEEAEARWLLGCCAAAVAGFSIPSSQCTYLLSKQPSMTSTQEIDYWFPASCITNDMYSTTS